MLMRGFTLLEVLIAMAISSILLLGASRFLPALQFGIMQQMRQQALEEDLWQQIFTVAKHLQRAGYCAGDGCGSEPLYLAANGECLIARWDANSNGRWETVPADDADSIGFRLKSGMLETQRGAANCEGNGWYKMSDPASMTITRFQVIRNAHSGFPPEFFLTLSATSERGESANAQYSVTGYNQ
ncbi:prepilin peptidase-dependent protein [Kluyvera genomosp. 1]|uniref:prepilin peptidase-dependent protein n=1 Tax=Kluyvera genomosp. 1 TaxID=2774053 RepID=UPI00068C7850|nr:prepilin peptidase-dependent protein [Kluyvera genomosp. 1]